LSLFLAFKEKHTILLALTSNQGAFDFQSINNTDSQPLYKSVLKTSKTWQNSENLMYVVGATKAEYLKDIRAILPESFLLVPGVGAQGGSLEDVCKFGMTKNIGLLVNSSRGIIYASQDQDFATKAMLKAEALQRDMATQINQFT
jgi:orotidine-5'-phosphate decarboxylase